VIEENGMISIHWIKRRWDNVCPKQSFNKESNKLKKRLVP